MKNIQIIDTTKNNLDEYLPRCFMKVGDTGCTLKSTWITKRFKEGLRVKQLYSKEDKKIVGFIEYINSENAYRGVSAKNYLFIHCIWINPNKHKKKGYGSILVNKVIEDAKKNKKDGVGIVVSNGSFMADKTLFEKNGFKEIEIEDKYSLLVKSFNNNNNNSDKPKFNDYKKELVKYKGLNIVYTNQCPWVAKSIDEFKKIAKEKGLKLNVKELKTAKDVQNGPSIYGIFALILNGKILANHYISKTRFLNIIKTIK